ncbi:PIN domain-like protein [Schizophyllum amplum]|uniref:PIN domain-like protein n=1 Tax=Schizophyllum amplum TaxID=97359 RepID=A0A550BSQ3_9AGAR|nr:PIN domain-like protein [Auriculariopsis ampla]
MGIYGLWETIEAVADTRSLMSVCIDELARLGRKPVLGVDASGFMDYAVTACIGQGPCARNATPRFFYSQPTINPEMAIVLKLCIQLLGLPAETLFVFDGTVTPRQPHTTAKTQEITRLTKALAEAFGYMLHDAPADAEAELAYLNVENMVDIVFAVDCGVVVFGAKLIVRSTDIRNRDAVQVYRRKDIEAMGLPLAGLPAFALISGGSHDQKGLPFFCMPMGLDIARAELGHRLSHLAGTGKLAEELPAWRASIMDWLSRYRYVDINQVPHDFPHLDIAMAYAAPVTSRMSGGVVLLLNMFDLKRVVTLCRAMFTPSAVARSPADALHQTFCILVEKFDLALWQGLYVHDLLRSATASATLPRNSFTRVERVEYYSRIDRRVAFVRFQRARVHALLQQVLIDMQQGPGLIVDGVPPPVPQIVEFGIPIEIFEFAATGRITQDTSIIPRSPWVAAAVRLYNPFAERMST